MRGLYDFSSFRGIAPVPPCKGGQGGSSLYVILSTSEGFDTSPQSPPCKGGEGFVSPFAKPGNTQRQQVVFEIEPSDLGSLDEQYPPSPLVEGLGGFFLQVFPNISEGVWSPRYRDPASLAQAITKFQQLLKQKPNVEEAKEG
ncbi:protein of unknown function [Nitrospina watsonii]|uniref:Uncharacterized protein n=1 Tax=Nitrospina watsonii TaxID=1323948 RepID=A0ABN8VYB1_9BACT|nr:protein of unknown function [Nitrospina watsonii]